MHEVQMSLLMQASQDGRHLTHDTEVLSKYSVGLQGWGHTPSTTSAPLRAHVVHVSDVVQVAQNGWHGAHT